MGLILECYRVTVIINGKEVERTLHASNKQELKAFLNLEYGKENVKKIEKA